MEADPTTRPKPPILFLHGVFGKPSLLQPWKRLLESEGYVVHAPALPGREPTDDAVLAGTGIEDCFTVALDAYDQIGEPAIVIGHSMGGLLTQKVAAARKPLLPSARTMREVPLNTLPTVEREALIPELVRDSGRVFREMSTGAASTRVAASQVRCPVLCVSAGSDRNVAPWISRRIAKRYGAEHQDHPGKPHWIIAESAIGDVAPPVLEWLRRTVT